MPTGRLKMRRIRDVLRLQFCQGLSERQVAASPGLSKTRIGTCLQRARQAGLTWPLPEGLEDDSLELLLFPAAPTVPDPERPVPDWVSIDRDLRRPGVTRMLLWEEYRGEEYRAPHPAGFGYTWFCTHFDAWKGRVRPTMRQTHVGGEKVFVDFAGDMIDVVDPESGEVRPMKLSVAAMGASDYSYAEAVASEGLEDWIGAQVRRFAFLGGVPKVVVPDNLKAAGLKADRYDPGLKAAVLKADRYDPGLKADRYDPGLKAAVPKADRYDPGLNRTCAGMAEHYGTALLPARPRKPRA